MNTCKDCEYRFIALGGESYCDYIDEDGLDICPDDGIVLDIEKDTCKMFGKKRTND